MFIQTEETPNPATMKFMPGREVMGQGTLEVSALEEAVGSPLAQSLFAIKGVRGVFLGRDFITVTKEESKNWATMKPPVLTAIMEHFTSNKPVMATPEIDSAATGAGDEDPVITKIRDLLDHKIRPAVAQDGGDITFQKFEDGVVYLNLQGSCAGCPSSAMTLKAGVENLLRHHIPEVREVRQVS